MANDFEDVPRQPNEETPSESTPLPKSNQTVFNYDDSRPGSQKTRRQCEFMASRPGKFVYAVDRNNVFSERGKLIEEFAKSSGRSTPVVILMNSETSANVLQNVRELPDKYSAETHVVAVITHEAMRSADLSHYNGWHLIIDEVPEAWTYQNKRNGFVRVSLNAFFNLKLEDGASWSRITVKDGVQPSDISNDDDANGIMAIYKKAKIGHAFANITTWGKAENWSWFSVWDFNELSVFQTVTIVANAFSESMTYKLMEKTGIQFSRIKINDEYKSRRLNIFYFDENNRAGTSFFKSESGTTALSLVGGFFKQYPIDFWSCNLDNGDYRPSVQLSIDAIKLPPLIAGSNSYLKYTKCAMIYSAKPSKQEIGFLKTFNLSAGDVIRSRETEALIQFVTRSSLRVSDDERDVTFYVYDKTQAEQVKKFFDGSSMKIQTTCEFVDVGIPARKSNEERQQKRLEKYKRYNKTRPGRGGQKNAE